MAISQLLEALGKYLYFGSVTFGYDISFNILYWNFNRRAIMTGRAVRVNSQLKSHKRFAKAFPKYCKLVDNARLFCTNGVGAPPKVNIIIFPSLLLLLKCQEGNLLFIKKKTAYWVE